MALFFMGCFIVCFPLVVRDVFGGSSGDLATLSAFNSLGLVLTILLTLRLGYVSQPSRALLLFQGLGAVVLLASGLMQNFTLFVAAVFCWGLCGGSDSIYKHIHRSNELSLGLWGREYLNCGKSHSYLFNFRYFYR